MTNQIVAEFISDWKNLDILKANEFAEGAIANEDIFQAITHVLEESERFRTLYDDVLSTLFSMYRSSEKKLRTFAAQFVPSLVYKYLYELHSQKKCVMLETLIRGMFELESAADDRPPLSFRLANINLPSLYHDPGGVSTSWLSDSDLERLNTKTVKNVTRSSLVLTEERIRAPQRLPLCTEVWWFFNHRLPDLPKYCVPTVLKTISKLVTQGFHLGGPQRSHPAVRIVLSSKLLIEAVATVYYCAYNGAPTLAEQTLEEILYRANYQLWADAICVGSAVKHYLKASELPLQVEVSAFKKSIITNASFRTKKLPDDIPIVEKDSIPEDGVIGDGPSTSSTPISKSLSKLPHILSKIKRNSVVVINEEGDVETMAMSTPPERKKSVDGSITAV